MIARTKMRCEASNPATGREGGIVQLSQVESVSAESEDVNIFKSAGLFMFSLASTSVLNKFEVGKEYYVDISVAE